MQLNRLAAVLLSVEALGLNSDMCQVVHLDQSISYFQDVSIAKELGVLG